MSRKNPRKSIPQKLARTALVLMLSIGGSVALSQAADSQEDNTQESTFHPATNIPIPPAVIQSWKDAARDYPKKLAEYKQDQETRRKRAEKVIFAQDKDMDYLAKSYPFLQEDFQRVKDMQNKVTDYMNKNPDHSLDVSVHIYIAENKDSQSGINLLFVEKKGQFYCGNHGCPTSIYVDEGEGYKKALDVISDDIYISKSDGQVSLFFSLPQGGKDDAPEWILKDHKFVKNDPPRNILDTQLYLQWRHEHPDENLQ